MSDNTAWGFGLATSRPDGKVLDVWYPHPQLGSPPDDAQPDPLLLSLESDDELRRVHLRIVKTVINLDDEPSSAAGAYLRLHLLSWRLAQPNSINLDGIFSVLENVAWTSSGPCFLEDFDATRMRIRAARNTPIRILSVDKFPRMVDYVIPSGVRIADGNNVRLGAYLSEGTTVMHAGFVNYNAGSLGRAMIEGRVSQGVVVDDGADIGGGASTMGILSADEKKRVRVGKRSLLGANSGLGIALGDDCIVEPGLYVTAGTRVTLLPTGGVTPGREGYIQEPDVVPARMLSGLNNIMFRRNSTSGAVEALPRPGANGSELQALMQTS
ncbi:MULTISPECIES: DapH/DapD/GlmU-related protein [unclassified Actinobaculum]|uniref:DapH/DapD/GlmU-related protein n=1 Tax=unclassified Actinobaculum TaxID=2609299 RepID=UPI000D527628|nr:MULTISPECIES: DapH/DapD/GlmU-related protein [unclassified Actinobaculum]AWE41932.1 2,3,4,5-tetrahydropyridine-2,6-dicarboxylate N-succinyltransferase [Actinobaculum sp. 313]RTE50152.1 2,3,4,5-tetrahydropyridine-2,6-dicarboxylate N-succinyltransferase [Actinobaculum sp. 352]